MDVDVHADDRPVSPAPKLSSRQELRVFGVALVGLFAVGAVGVVVSAGTGGLARVTAPGALGMFAFLLTIWVVPAGAPAAVVGAFLAIRLMNRQSTAQPFSFWAWRGIAVGASLGAIGAALWFTVMFIAVPDHLRRVIGPVTALGAGAGALVGLLMACYCWNACRLRTV